MGPWTLRDINRQGASIAKSAGRCSKGVRTCSWVRDFEVDLSALAHFCLPLIDLSGFSRMPGFLSLSLSLSLSLYIYIYIYMYVCVCMCVHMYIYTQSMQTHLIVVARLAGS